MIYKIYEIPDLNNKQTKTNIILELILTLLVNALVLMMASAIFNNFHIESFLYAFLAALVIMILNNSVKPIIKKLTLPITIFSLGLFYPFINVIILKLAGLILGDKFVVVGWFIPFFIAIFISIMTIILNLIITKQIIGGRK